MVSSEKNMQFLSFLFDETLYPVQFSPEKGKKEVIDVSEKSDKIPETNTTDEPESSITGEPESSKTRESELPETGEPELPKTEESELPETVEPEMPAVEPKEVKAEEAVKEKSTAEHAKVGDSILIFVDDPYNGDEIAPKYALIIDNFMKAASIKKDQYRICKIAEASEIMESTKNNPYYIIMGQQEVINVTFPELPDKENTIITPHIEELALNRKMKRSFWEDLQKMSKLIAG